MARQLRVPTPRIRIPTRVPKLPRLPDPNQPDIFEEMTLQEHLEELRTRIFRACLSIGIAFIGGLIVARPLLQTIERNAQTPEGLDIGSPTDPITLFMKTALYVAICFAMPAILWQLIGFLAPGLTRKEKRFLFASLPFVSILFIAGAAYGFFFAAPRALDFLSGWLNDIFSWDPDGSAVINFYLTLMIGLGTSFQLPIIMFILARLNIVSPRRMRDYRKYSAIAILIISAIITPSTDPINMAVVAVPLLALYELGIVVARVFAVRKPAGAEAAAG